MNTITRVPRAHVDLAGLWELRSRRALREALRARDYEVANQRRYEADRFRALAVCLALVEHGVPGVQPVYSRTNGYGFAVRDWNVEIEIVGALNLSWPYLFFTPADRPVSVWADVDQRIGVIPQTGPGQPVRDIARRIIGHAAQLLD